MVWELLRGQLDYLKHTQDDCQIGSGGEKLKAKSIKLSSFRPRATYLIVYSPGRSLAIAVPGCSSSNAALCCCLSRGACKYAQETLSVIYVHYVQQLELQCHHRL